MENEPVSNSYKLDAAPVEAGLVERVNALFNFLAGISNSEFALIVMGDDGELRGKIVGALGDASQIIESQSAEIERQAEDIARLHHLDIHNTELLEAAIEGQSYWQARAERAEEALREAREEIQGYGEWLNDVLQGHDPTHYRELAKSDFPRVIRLRASIDRTLADAQPTQEPQP